MFVYIQENEKTKKKTNIFNNFRPVIVLDADQRSTQFSFINLWLNLFIFPTRMSICFIFEFVDRNCI